MNKKNHLIFALLVSVAFCASTKISFQLQWFPQGEYAPIILAQELNYFGEAKLNVAILSGGPNINSAYYVQKEVADIGIGWLEAVINVNREESDKKVIVVAQLMQKSSQRLVTLKSSGLTTLHSLKSKRVALWSGLNVMPIQALRGAGLEPESYDLISLGATPYALISKGSDRVDAIQVTTFNELAQLFTYYNVDEDRYFNMDDFNIIKLETDNVSSMEDCMFVREEWLKKEGNREILKSLLESITKGAIYSRDNEIDALKYLYPSNELDRWQIRECSKLYWTEGTEFGHIDEGLYKLTLEILGMQESDMLFEEYTDNSIMKEVRDKLVNATYNLTKAANQTILPWCVTPKNKTHICSDNERNIELKPYPAGIVVTMIVLSSILCLLSIGTLIFTIICREAIPFRSASPPYLYMILSGSILLYVGTIVYISIVNRISCYIYIWFISIGFTLLYAPYIAKTWRIYRIFNDSSTKTVGVNPYGIMIICILMISVDIILLVLFSALESLTISVVPSPVDDYRLYTKCNFPVILGYILIGYKGVLIIISLFLAYLVRNVKMSLYNESRIMISSICITSIVVIFAFVILFLQSNPNATLIIQSLGVCMVSFFNVYLMFFKKIYQTLTYTPENLKQLYKQSSTTGVMLTRSLDGGRGSKTSDD